MEIDGACEGGKNLTFLQAHTQRRKDRVHVTDLAQGTSPKKKIEPPNTAHLAFLWIQMVSAQC